MARCGEGYMVQHAVGKKSEKFILANVSGYEQSSRGEDWK